MAGKKKWAKGKVREKINNLVVLDQKLHDKIMKEVPKMKVVTIFALTERLKINGSLARAVIAELVKRGEIAPVSINNRISVYTRTKEPEPKKEDDSKKAKKKKGKKKKE